MPRFHRFLAMLLVAAVTFVTSGAGQLAHDRLAHPGEHHADLVAGHVETGEVDHDHPTTPAEPGRQSPVERHAACAACQALSSFHSLGSTLTSAALCAFFEAPSAAIPVPAIVCDAQVLPLCSGSPRGPPAGC